MFGTSDSRYPGSQIAVMLEEIQVSPSELLEVMGLAVSTASRTGIGGTSVGTEVQVEFMGCLIGVQALAQNLPGGSQTQSQGEDVIGAHADPPRRPLPPTWAWVKFHLKRRRTKKSTGGTAQTVVDLIGKLYHLEKQARDAKLDADRVRAMRQEKAKPIMGKIKALLLEREKITPPKSLLGKAIAYALGQWDRVVIYLEDGRLRPDNNLAENAIRPFAVGRKNWLFSGSPAGAAASAAIYSLVETAKANGLEPLRYLHFVFEKLPLAKSQEDLRALLPQFLDSKIISA